jgi:hypothetical protein
VRVAALVALLLTLPGLRGGLVADDWFHRAHLDPVYGRFPEGRGALLEMFNFFPADRAVLLQNRDEGTLPWWIDPEIRGGFLRPVAAATHAFDWWVVGDHPWLHHAHSLAWSVAAVFAAAAFFRA